MLSLQLTNKPPHYQYMQYIDFRIFAQTRQMYDEVYLLNSKKQTCNFFYFFICIIEKSSIFAVENAGLVAQLDRVSDYGSDGCGFDSRLVHIRPLTTVFFHVSTITLSTTVNQQFNYHQQFYPKLLICSAAFTTL